VLDRFEFVQGFGADALRGAVFGRQVELGLQLLEPAEQPVVRAVPDGGVVLDVVAVVVVPDGRPQLVDLFAGGGLVEGVDGREVGVRVADEGVVRGRVAPGVGLGHAPG